MPGFHRSCISDKKGKGAKLDAFEALPAAQMCIRDRGAGTAGQDARAGAGRALALLGPSPGAGPNLSLIHICSKMRLTRPSTRSASP